ncbi:MAG: hypothetical protein SF339_00605, partial [Blastocatellia bacterium]|nr:hypothetical protein [Blastocatellia bacterium]
MQINNSCSSRSEFRLQADGHPPKTRRLKANGVKLSLTRRRESAKWKEASLLRVFAFDSEIPRAARPAGVKRKNAKRKKTRRSLFFASSRLRVRP